MCNKVEGFMKFPSNNINIMKRKVSLMVRYSDELIDEIRNKNDIVDVISQYVTLKRSGRNFFGLCPFHNEKSPSFSVSPDKQIFHCFGCGVGGNVFHFIQKIENISFLDDWRGSSLHVAQIKAGNQEYRYIDDLRGGDVFGENTMSKNLFKLVLEMNNAKGKGRREVIEALKNSMNFSKNKDIKVKDGKLVEIEESTRDSVNSNEIETDKVNTEKDGEER